VEDAGVAVPLVDQISLGVLTVWVPRDAVESSIAAHGRQTKRRGGSLPAHVVMYFVIAMALHAGLDYEGVLRKLTAPLRFWRSWDPAWRFPTSGAITQARQRLGFEPVKECFERVAVPVAGLLTPDAFCAGRRLVSLDGMVFDLPDTEDNRDEFGVPSGGVFPQARVVTLTESASHVSLGARIGGVAGKGSGERSAAAELIPLLARDMMLVCDQGFYSFDLWCQAVETEAAVLWRLGDVMALPVVSGCGDGSYLTVLFAPGVGKPERARLLERARAGDDLADASERARLARAVEYGVPDRGSGDLICLLASILDPMKAPAPMLAEAYHQRWQHEAANKEIKTQMRGPARVLRSKSPDMVRQEIYGYLLAHYAVCAFICQAAEETGIDPDRVKFTNTFRIIGDRLADPEAFPP
jgi:transposase IS4-like protein/DDE family transposase